MKDSVKFVWAWMCLVSGFEGPARRMSNQSKDRRAFAVNGSCVENPRPDGLTRPPMPPGMFGYQPIKQHGPIKNPPDMLDWPSIDSSMIPMKED